MYVKVTGYAFVEDEDLDATGELGVSADGHDEIKTTQVDDLEDLTLAPDDRDGAGALPATGDRAPVSVTTFPADVERPVTRSLVDNDDDGGDDEPAPGKAA